MAALLGVLGFIGLIGGLIWLGISFARKQPRRNPIYLTVGSLAAFIVGLVLSPTPTPREPQETLITSAASTPTPTVAPSDLVQVVSVTDGDTINVLIGTERKALRYIGIDTPETVAPGQPVGCFGQEASNENKRLVEGKMVRLEKDVSETDRFGRLLRYVYLTDGAMVNELMVSNGFAQSSTFPPDVKYQERFSAAQRAAQEQGKGLWTTCAVAPEPTATPVPATATPVPPTATAPPVTVPTATLVPPRGNCSPAYPSVCIPPPPPDLDCGDIPHRRFTVLPPDPHRFDGAPANGIGCESN